MPIPDVDDRSGRPTVLYFHGASSSPDPGPPDRLGAELGLRIERPVRPGYDTVPAAPDLDLRQVAAAAIDRATGSGAERVVAIGWSGGGPYALAAALGHPAVVGVGLLGSWAPMQPPDPGLPVGVRLFMRLAQRVPRPMLRWSMAAVGLRTIGHVDDVRRVARDWGFTVDEVAARVPVAVWHADGDPEVPIGPWRDVAGATLVANPGDDHRPSDHTWTEALTWAAALLGAG